MVFTIPRLDHVVVDVRDRVDEAVRVYNSIGFQLTERGRHTLGSINHLAVFDTDYLELLGVEKNAPTVRADILGFPVGLNGLVFATDQTDKLFSDLQTCGIPVEEPVAFNRPVNVAGGSAEAKFRVVRLRAGTIPDSRVYFCHHLTRDLVWRPEWRRHANGATSLSRVIIAVRDPAASSGIFKRMFGPDTVRPGADGGWTLAAGTVQVELIPRDALARRFGDAIPDPAGRADYMAALSIRTASLSQAARALQAGGISRVQIEPQRILVPAAAAMNVALEFVE